MFSTEASPFPTTSWSHVRESAGKDKDKTRVVLDHLCRKYWRPIYAFVRHRGYSVHDAEDLTQAYFADLLERGYIEQADEAKGRFRSFLIQDMKFFMQNHAGKARAQKRGGDVSLVPLDVVWAESCHEPADPAGKDADAYFDRQWALETVRLARDWLRQDYERQGKKALFAALQTGLISPPTSALQEAWQLDLGMSPGALKVALHRLRERFRAALEAQIMETVTTEEELRSEMRHLREALDKSHGES